MKPIGSSFPPSSRSNAGFDSTLWSVVLAGRNDDEAGRRAALEHLCRAYWSPLYSYLRRHGFPPADAEDHTQGFFAELLAGDFLRRPDPARGRLRSYLIGALRHYLAHQREYATAQKRGGGVTPLPLEAAEREFAALAAPGLDPGATYERAWAVTLLTHAVRRLEEEQTAAKRGEIFHTLHPFLYAAPGRGDYERAATRLHTSRATVAVWLHRLSQRLMELVTLEVAATLENPADAGQELQHLRQSLGRL